MCGVPPIGPVPDGAVTVPLSVGHTASFPRKHNPVPVSKALRGKLGLWRQGVLVNLRRMYEYRFKLR